MMKDNFLILLFLLFTAGMIASCKKLIEIPSNPPTAISQTEQFSDSANTMTAIAAVYSYYAGQQTGFAYQDGFLAEYTGLSSDELSTTQSNADLQQFYTYGLTQLNKDVPILWSAVYTNMYSVNAVLEGITGNNNLPAGFIKQATGEILVVRSLYYFNMINLFGGIPLITTTDYRHNAGLPRASTDTVYNQIISDLTTSEKDLTAAYPSAGRARPNLYTALTLMAKVHLYRGNWQEAYNEADSVIHSGIYSLEPDPNNVFVDGSLEAIWQLPVPATSQTTVTAEAGSFIPSSPGTAPNYLVSSFLLKAFEPGDLRRQDWIDSVTATVGGNTQTFYYPYKYKNRLATQTPAEGYMVFRLAEVYLIRAEAAAHLNNFNQALSDLNKIRNRSGLPDSNVSGQAAILSAIMHERQVELFTEWGSRWYDLKRTGTAAAVLGTEKTGWQESAALYPVPQTQLDLNNQLTQNPGY